MEIIRIAALALTGVLLAALMKSVNRELTIYIILATVVILFVTIIDRLVYVFDFLGDIALSAIPLCRSVRPSANACIIISASLR